MSDAIRHCLTIFLTSNTAHAIKEISRILRKICNNILEAPEEPKYRKLYLSNEVVSKKLLRTPGAIECLFAIGFKEDDNGFLLPVLAPLDQIRKLYYHLNAILHQLTNSQPIIRPVIHQPPVNVQSPATSIARPTNNSFFSRLTAHFKDVLRYEEEHLLDVARQLLPLSTLEIKALEKMRIIQREVKLKKLEAPLVIEDLVLNEMMIWFKTKFFTWVDSPECHRCKAECKFNRSIKSYYRKITRIEIHKCTKCGVETQFPRYSDPECLLRTRKGRCGEWANCFTLFCRAAKFDARLVVDQTDHVWTEVWSDFHKRWIHVDPCENSMDSPLLYERGWGKLLSYIFAFSRDEIVDVTWRYTRNYKEVMKRRKICSEKSLILFIEKLNQQRQNEFGYSSVRRKYVTIRRLQELVGMITAPPGCTKPGEEVEKDLQYGSRQSGSLAWKLTRGEINDSEQSSTPYQWIIPKHVNAYELNYFILNDTYIVKDATKNTIIQSKKIWRTGVDTIEGRIFRKEELDWKTVYLARLPVNDMSKITWTFVVEDQDKTYIDYVKFRATTATFHGGAVTWEIKGIRCGKDKSKNEVKVLNMPNNEKFKTKALTGSIQIEISATLSGGQGEQSWQHAQLFRKSMTCKSKVPSMSVGIILMQKP